MSRQRYCNLVGCGVLLAGSFAAAQSPGTRKDNETPPLIDSIQGPALSKASEMPVWGPIFSDLDGFARQLFRS